MKATELMIGDWVSINGKQVWVWALTQHGVVGYKDGDHSYYGSEDDIEPIPLTEEILNKNFPKPDGDYWVNGDFPIIGYSAPCITDGNRPYVEVSIYDPACVLEFDMFIHYVHELQHALRLCGFEKEIEL